ncbi:Putative fructokinase [Thalassocella blandensis]|nr:Putative fructokinase [Thalassocella blandensis]
MNQNDTRPLLAGIEAGGTKFNCVLGYSPEEIIVRQKIPTTTPEETFAKVFDFFADQEKQLAPIAAFGIASFGPIDLHLHSDTYGFITATPKPHWSHTNVVKAFKDFRNIPVAFDTDVNGAALGEQHYGAAKDIANFVYVTVGTGIGAGVFSDGKLVNGALHPEIGHMLVPSPEHINVQHSADTVGLINPNHIPQLAHAEKPYTIEQSLCPFHQNCLTAFAAGPALELLWHKPAQQLAEDHPAWDYQAYYLALMCMNLSLFYAPELIILGGGVMDQQQLFAKTRKTYDTLMGNYMLPNKSLDQFIIPPGKPGQSGEIGALVLAQQALHTNT